MSELKEVGLVVAVASENLVPLIIQNKDVPSVTDHEGALAILERVVTQSPAFESRRIWAVIFAVLTAVLAVPEVQSYLGPWAPVITAALSAALAGWSKATDPRPTR